VKVFCVLSPNCNFAYIILTLLNFVSATPHDGRSWFTMDVLGFSAIMFIIHAAFWYPLFLPTLSLSFSFSVIINHIILRWCLLLILEYCSSIKINKLYQSNIYHETKQVDESRHGQRTSMHCIQKWQRHPRQETTMDKLPICRARVPMG
jgi:hypothetical protein